MTGFSINEVHKRQRVIMHFPHPGCGYPTAFAAKVIAVCDLIFGLIGIFWFIYILDGYGLLMKAPSGNDDLRSSSPPSTTVTPTNASQPFALIYPASKQLNSLNTSSPTDSDLFSITNEGIEIYGTSPNIILSGIYTLINLFAFVLLLSAAHERNITKLKVWFIIRAIIFSFKLVVYMIYFIIGAPIFTTQTPHVIFMFIHLYGLWVVYVFIQEIRHQRCEMMEVEARSEIGTQGSGETNFAFIVTVTELYAMLSPTCGKVPLQKATKFIAFVDLILGLTGIFWFVYMLERYQIISLDPFEEPGSSIRESKVEQWGAVATDVNTSFTKPHKVLSTNHKAISLTLFTLFDLINLTLFVVLLLGAHRKNIELCLTWFYVRCAVFVFKVILFIIYLIAGRPLYGQIPYIIFMFIHLYGLWVVNSYVEELKTSKYQGELNVIQEKKRQEVNDWEDANGIQDVLKIRTKMDMMKEEAFKDNKGFEKL